MARAVSFLLEGFATDFTLAFGFRIVEEFGFALAAGAVFVFAVLVVLAVLATLAFLAGPAFFAVLADLDGLAPFALLDDAPAFAAGLAFFLLMMASMARRVGDAVLSTLPAEVLEHGSGAHLLAGLPDQVKALQRLWLILSEDQ